MTTPHLKPAIRTATPDDLDALHALEECCFSGDRISRRSFRHLLKVESAVILIAEIGAKPVGSAVVLFRSGTALARLYSLAVDPALQGRGIGAALMAASEAVALEHDRLTLRLEVREDNAVACKLYETRGYRPCGRVAGYYEDGGAALRFEKLLHDTSFARAAVPYYQQSTEFTCGPACMAMALKHFDDDIEISPTLELRLWRETTTIYLASGHGGCGPYGLAVAAASRGLDAEVRVNTEDFLFLASVRDPEKRRVMRIAQQDYRDQAKRRGIPDHREILSPRALAATISEGAVALVLISGYQMYQRKVPHWVLVHASDARHLVIHDPWLEYEGFESATDSSNLPIPDAAFDRMARWGSAGVRAQIILRKAR